MEPFWEWAYHWQTLIAAFIALAAAAWTVHTIRQQIIDDKERHADLLHRRSLAARAQMPDALTEFCSFTSETMSYLEGRKEELPAPPIEALDKLKRAIEFVHPGAAGKLFRLVSWYQVHTARMAHWRPGHHGPEHAEHMYDVTLLRAYVHQLYDYARNETDEVTSDEPTCKEMKTALSNTVGLPRYVERTEVYADVDATIGRRHS